MSLEAEQAWFRRWRHQLIPIAYAYSIYSIKLWTAEIASARPAVQYTDVKDSTGMSELLQNIVRLSRGCRDLILTRTQRTFGFCVVENMPATPEATESLLNSIGPIRNTHYGGCIMRFPVHRGNANVNQAAFTILLLT